MEPETAKQKKTREKRSRQEEKERQRDMRREKDEREKEKETMENNQRNALAAKQQLERDRLANEQLEREREVERIDRESADAAAAIVTQNAMKDAARDLRLPESGLTFPELPQRREFAALPKFPYSSNSYTVIDTIGAVPTKEQVEEIMLAKFGTLDPGEARKYLALKHGDVGSQEDFFWRHRQLVAIMNKPLKEEWEPTATMSVTEVSMSDELYRAAVGKEFTPRVMSCLDRCLVRRRCRDLNRRMQQELEGSKKHGDLSAELRQLAARLRAVEDQKELGGELTMRKSLELRKRSWRILGVHQRVGTFQLPRNFMGMRKGKVGEVEILNEMAKTGLYGDVNGEEMRIMRGGWWWRFFRWTSSPYWPRGNICRRERQLNGTSSRRRCRAG